MIQRSKGHSIVEFAARRSGTLLYDYRLKQSFNYLKKKQVTQSILLLPENARPDYQDREFFWNIVEMVEKRTDAQLARQVHLAMPQELPFSQNSALVTEYANKQWIEKGFAADISFYHHQDNPTAYLLLTLRPMNESGWGNKERSTSRKEQILTWRSEWANITNRYLENNNSPARIDHRSLLAQGKEQQPQPTLGKAAHHAAKRGVYLDRWQQHQEMLQQNQNTNNSAHTLAKIG